MMQHKHVFRQGQSAIEYLIITAFVLGILIPSLLLVTKTVQDYRQSTAVSALNRIGQDLAGNAEAVYFFGQPSQVILGIDMPEGVTNFSVHRNDPVSGCTRCTELRMVATAGFTPDCETSTAMVKG